MIHGNDGCDLLYTFRHVVSLTNNYQEPGNIVHISLFYLINIISLSICLSTYVHQYIKGKCIMTLQKVDLMMSFKQLCV